jgi:hypothetical protein
VSERVKVGQVWEDMDWRIKGRRLRVYSVGDDYARVENVETGKRTRIKVKRLKPGSTGYRLVEDPR